jgi:RimJ/RimL family protein N-acetyltransferase
MAVVLGDPALHQFIGDGPLDEAGLRDRYVRLVAGSPDPAECWLNWVVRDRAEGRLVGTVQATLTASGAEVAWVVGTRWQGNGFATEAGRAMVDWLVAHGVTTVVAHVHPDHAASASVAAASGLSRTDRWHDGEVRWDLTR